MMYMECGSVVMDVVLIHISARDIPGHLAAMRLTFAVADVLGFASTLFTTDCRPGVRLV